SELVLRLTASKAEQLIDKKYQEIQNRLAQLRTDLNFAKFAKDNLKEIPQEARTNIINLLFVEGNYLKAKDTLSQWTDESLKKQNKCLTADSESFRDLTYAMAELSKIYADYRAQRTLFLEIMQNKEYRKTEELFSVYVTLSQAMQNSLLDTSFGVGKNNFHTGVNIGGELGTITDAANIIYGLCKGTVERGLGMGLAYTQLYDDFTKLAQLPEYKKFFKDVGGLLIPMPKEESKFGIELLFMGNMGKRNLVGLNLWNVVNVQVGEQTQIGANIWLAKVKLGVDVQHRIRGVIPSVIADASLFGDWLYVIKTDFGYYLYFPTVAVKDGKPVFNKEEPGYSYNMNNFGVCLNKILVSFFKFESQFKEDPAVFVPSLAQIEVLSRATRSEEPNEEIDA
ncbi:MAG: hypothetical protein NTW13_02185, partial [Candidatus Omnitrophica bacterium]|nr:hypothetical protein [Candidatus Omnitrophota bacterium]